MRLFEHPEFEQAVLRAAEHFQGRGWRPAIIEKDYYVTEALRIVALTAGDHIIFKGGTSLSKGWNLSAFRKTSTSSSIRNFLGLRLASEPSTGNSRNCGMPSANTRH